MAGGGDELTALTTFVASCTDAVLAHASSKGVLLRAAKDVAAGKVTLGLHEAARAELVVEGETVQLSAKALADCRCTCAAAGVCRHIVAAVLFLRAGVEAPPPEGDLAQTTFDALAEMAGADWPAALALARQGGRVEAGGVQFPDSGDQVVLVPGRPWTEALYKGGPAARRKRAVVAAVLVLAAKAGRDLPPEPLADALQPVSPDLLDRVQAALESAALALAVGNLALARDQLFTTAIAARVEAVPRLAGALRSLSEGLDPDALRQSDQGPADLLADLAGAYALAEALRSFSNDMLLTGVLSRNFAPSGPRQMAILGVDVWRNRTGARGMTVFLADLATGRLHRATEARGPGLDPAFDPAGALRLPLWSTGTPLDMMGRILRFDDAMMAEDGALGLSQVASLQVQVSLSQLEQAGAVQRQWQGLGAVMQAALGRGLRRSFGPAPVVLAPQRCDPPRFDPYEQAMLWRWRDGAGGVVDLTLPDLPDGLGGQENRVLAGLVALDRPNRGRLLSLWLTGEDRPFALPFQPLPKLGGWQELWDQRARLRPGPSLALHAGASRVDRLRARGLEAVLTHLAGAGLAWPDALLAEAEALGLSVVARLMQGFARQRSAAAALQLAYALQASAGIAALTDQ